MAFWKIVTLACTASIIADAKWVQHQKRDIPSNICDSVYNNTNKVQCFCVNDKKEPPTIKYADCYLTVNNIAIDDIAWTAFKTLSTVQKITLTNSRGIPLTYVPTEALKETKAVTILNIKYGTINTIGAFAFANHSSLQDLTLRGNQITILDPYAFIHHNDLKTISLDINNIVEINRNVFVDLPALEKLYLTNNQISTIHDRAFINLINLKELEIDRNKVFSLNFAVFEGLKNLEKLDLSSNSLEVIGDNTFQALENLKFLNLEGNKIQMLDEKAFNGLGNLQTLSLARNKLTDIDNDKIFDGLKSLVSLSLKGNQISELKNTVMAPILSNFYGNNSNLDVEDNNFPCDCRLDWFISLMNKTLNKHLKIHIDNIKCAPDSVLRAAWTKIEETEKSTPQALEEEEPQAQEYEYYDETQLNGKMFYSDVRDLLNCSKDLPEKSTSIQTVPIDNASPTANSVESTTAVKVTNKDVMDVSPVDTTTKTNEITKSEKNKREKNDIEQQQAFTTTRLATVSAKPMETKIYDNMASDEAKPDKIKTHRSIQEESNDSRRVEEDPKANNANKNFGCVLLLLIIVLYSSFQV